MGQVVPGRRGYHINNAYGHDGLKLSDIQGSYTTCRYFANKEQLHKSVKQEESSSRLLARPDVASAMLLVPRVSCYTQLWITNVMPQATPSVPTPTAAAVSSLLHCTQWDDRQNSHITLSTVKWKEGLNISYLRAMTCTFFTNLARWKFLYENCLVEIARELYDILAYVRCLISKCSLHIMLLT